MFVLDYHIYGPKSTGKKTVSVIEEANEEDEEDGTSSVAQEEYKPILDLCIDENLLSFLSECVHLLRHSFFIIGSQLTYF